MDLNEKFEGTREANKLVCNLCGHWDYFPPIVIGTKCPKCKDGSMKLKEKGVKIRKWT